MHKVLVLVTLAVLLAATPTLAQVPATMSYQGRVLQNTADQDPETGPVDIVFSIWSGPESDGSAVQLWTESWNGVALSNGIFSVLLGSNGAPLVPALFQNDASLYLQLEIDGETLTPRQQLGAAPFAAVDQPANELQDLSLVGTSLSISGSGASVSLASLDEVASTTAGAVPFWDGSVLVDSELYVNSQGKLALLGDAEFDEQLTIWAYDSPTIRLRQGGGAFGDYRWDIGGNEFNFFVRDQEAATLPFRIEAGARENSLYVDVGGKVGIGGGSSTDFDEQLTIFAADSPTIRLDQRGGAYPAYRWDIGGNEFNFFVRDKVTNLLPFRVFPNAPEDSLVIEGSGEVGIGTQSPNFRLHVNGSAGKPGGGSWSDSSDARLKKDVRPLSGRESLGRLLNLQGVSFEWIDPVTHQPGRHAGFIAQELEAVFPEWVTEQEPSGTDRELVGAGEKMKTISFPHGFNAHVVEALKEQQRQITALRAANEDLRAVLCALAPTAEICAGATPAPFEPSAVNDGRGGPAPQP